jgi:hypothetical protein
MPNHQNEPGKKGPPIEEVTSTANRRKASVSSSLSSSLGNHSRVAGGLSLGQLPLGDLNPWRID